MDDIIAFCSDPGKKRLFDQLSEQGFLVSVGEEDRLRAIVLMLFEQDIMCFEDMVGVRGVEHFGLPQLGFTDQEIAFVEAVFEHAQLQSRCTTGQSGSKNHSVQQQIAVQAGLESSKRLLADAGVGGPRKVLRAVQASVVTSSEKSAWLERARVNAIAGACPKSHPGVISGMRC